MKSPEWSIKSDFEVWKISDFFTLRPQFWIWIYYDLNVIWTSCWVRIHTKVTYFMVLIANLQSFFSLKKRFRKMGLELKSFFFWRVRPECSGARYEAERNGGRTQQTKKNKTFWVPNPFSERFFSERKSFVSSIWT